MRDYQTRMAERARQLRARGSVRVLGVETSCDETAAAVVADGRQVLGQSVITQMKLHALYGGVVPEIASRQHILAVDAAVDEALRGAGMALEDVDAVAVTYGPGLVGALLVGVTAAKALAFAADKPLYGVHHIQGHICANFIQSPRLAPPFLCLVVSGGHTHLVMVEEDNAYRLLGRTRDDAAGEAFDKVARVLGLGYPGGPAIDRAAASGDDRAIPMPRAFKGVDTLDFSFSGLKTFVVNQVHQLEQKGQPIPVNDFAASFRRAAVEDLVGKTLKAARAEGVGQVALAGGVAANFLLRARMAEACEAEGLQLAMPSLALCTDNAAMIASAGYYQLMGRDPDGLDLNAVPDLTLFA